MSMVQNNQVNYYDLTFKLTSKKEKNNNKKSKIEC